MFVEGIALPFNHSLYRPVDGWPKLHEWTMGLAPGPPAQVYEAPGQLADHLERIRAAQVILQYRLRIARPEVLVILASDRNRLFSDVQVPQIWIYTGEHDIWGSSRLSELGEPPDGDMIRFKPAPVVANFIREELAYQNFDISYGETLNPMGQPDYGMDASVVNAVRFVRPKLDIPVVTILLNTQLQPMLGGARCQALGKAIGAAIGERSERIALIASGGMWHDHHGTRAGFVDDRLDQWVLTTLGRGLSERMSPLFAVDSDTGYGGLAELRLWSTLGAACESFGAKAETLDYFPSYMAGAGIGFAYWPARPEGV